MKIILPLLTAISFHCSQAQINESFSDGDFSSNPVWKADTSKWKVSNDFRLQSNSTLANDVFLISTRQSLSGPLEWKLKATLNFNTSSVNYVDVFLIATDSNLNASSNYGYFIRLGNTDDDICLYRKEGANSIKIIDGADGWLNSSNNDLSLTITRDQLFGWSFSCSKINSSSTYYSAYCTDSIFKQSGYFGISIRQSTASFFFKHFFDDISVSPLIPDTIPPLLLKSNVLSTHEIELLFNEPIDSGGIDTVNFMLTDRSEFPATVLRDSIDFNRITLYFNRDIPARQLINIKIGNLKDRYGNKMKDTLLKIAYYVPLMHDVLITELMADPEPVVGLPAAEWMELYNNSVFSISLKDWRLQKPGSASALMPDVIIWPGEYLILTSTSGQEKLYSRCNSIAVPGFPALTNSGDTILLLSDSGKLIHRICYAAEWHENEVKSQGGWSLEMIDLSRPCVEKDNWTSSSGFYGATPGAENAAKGSKPDTIPPMIVNAFCSDSLHVNLVFNESLDSNSAANTMFYNIDRGIGIPLSAESVSPFFKEVILTTSSPMLRDSIYQIDLQGSTDCSGNSIQNSRVRFARFSDCQKGDMLINELLFNPVSGGYDYVELYNNSKRTIDLSSLRIANKDVLGNAANSVSITSHPFAILPGRYVVVTGNRESLLQSFIIRNQNAILENKNLPGFPDDKGSVLLLNHRGEILDELNYADDWHFDLMDDPEGTSLERISMDVPTDLSSNWHSAAGRGTPGYENSQTYQSSQLSGTIIIDPPVFSPDMDGWQDVALIQYRFPFEGHVLSVVICSMEGAPIRTLANNLLAGASGMLKWDGLDDKARKLRSGTYIVCAEFFNSRGGRGKIKKPLVLASTY